jgi:hypothetical protein
MVRYIAAGILGCLYAAGSIWLVQGQGRAYRDSLHRERLASRETRATSSREPEGAITEPVPVATVLEPASPGSEPTTTKPTPSAVASRPDKPGEAEPRPVPSLATIAEAKPNSTNPTAVADTPGVTSGSVPDAATPPRLDPLWDRAELKKTWDLARLDVRDEVRIGDELNDLILQLNPPMRSSPLLRRVEEIADPLLKLRSRKEIEYKFTILDSDAVNAFSTPGGHVYVSRGLFKLVGDDEDYALEFVVGHEIAHVDLQHPIKCLRDPGVMDLAGGTVQKLYLLIIPFAYPDALEFEADAWVYRRMKQRERTDREALAFLRKFVGYAEAQGLQDGRGKPQVGRGSSPLENHLLAHTAAWKRLRQLNELTGKASNSSK